VRTLQLCNVHLRGRPVVAADDELHPYQRPIREKGIECRDAAPVSLGEQHADALAHGGSIAVARHVDEHRHETIEAVDASQHPHARPRLEVQDGFAPFPELLRLDLEQLVARKSLEHVHQRLSGVTGHRIRRSLLDRFHLAAHERDLARRPDVSLGGEEAHHADLAVERAVAAIGLDTDIVHVHTAMHPAHDARLGDDERRRRGVEPADLRCQIDQLGPATQDMDLRVAQDAEAGPLHRHEIAGLAVTRELVLASSQEREVARLQPAQEGDRLVQLALRNLRRPGFEMTDGRLHMPQHLLPVVDDLAHGDEHVQQRFCEIPANGLRQRLEVDRDVAFLASVVPVLVAGTDEHLQATHLVALDLEDRMQQKAHSEAARLKLTDDRVDQERHVVVQDLDDCTVGAVRGRRPRPDPQLGLLSRLLDDEVACRPSVGRKPVRRRRSGILEALLAIEHLCKAGSLGFLTQCSLHLADEALVDRFCRQRHGALFPSDSF
jgi:hypothetical protein